MKQITFNGLNGGEVEAFIKDNNLEFTEFIRCVGEVFCGGYYKAPCVIVLQFMFSVNINSTSLKIGCFPAITQDFGCVSLKDIEISQISVSPAAAR